MFLIISYFDFISYQWFVLVMSYCPQNGFIPIRTIVTLINTMISDYGSMSLNLINK